MSSRGQSLSMFVVQRAFSRVRRGYDPDEVDRHLELVSQWFTSTDIGQALVHERAELDQRERAVAAREAEQAQSIEGARLEAEATL
jgi:DivIVA domain-containing protein